MITATREETCVWLLYHYCNHANEPFVELLRKERPDWHFKSVPGSIDPGYRSRLRLYLFGWPALFLYGLAQGLRTLRQDCRQLVVVAWSHLPLLPVVLLSLVQRNPPRLVLYGFIYSPRRSRLLNWMRWCYYRMLLSRISLVVCHSQHECDQYRVLFGRSCRFAHVPFCLNVPRLNNIPKGNYALSAGRSGRDYPLLLRAYAGTDAPLRIVCDHFSIPGTSLPANVELMRGCYDGDYLKVLAGAQVVIIPLAVEDVSAGQMVLLQAMAMGKPIIVTRTPTIEEYATHKKDCLLVQMGDEQSLRAAVQVVHEDSVLASSLGDNARTTYEGRHSIESEARYLIRCAEQAIGLNSGPTETETRSWKPHHAANAVKEFN
jgi:glycosyltransferase involved in cell wall biosynthesis